VQDTYPVKEHEIPEGVIFGQRDGSITKLQNMKKRLPITALQLKIIENTDNELAKPAMAIAYINRGYSYYFIGMNEKARMTLKWQ